MLSRPSSFKVSRGPDLAFWRGIGPSNANQPACGQAEAFRVRGFRAECGDGDRYCGGASAGRAMCLVNGVPAASVRLRSRQRFSPESRSAVLTK